MAKVKRKMVDKHDTEYIPIAVVIACVVLLFILSLFFPTIKEIDKTILFFTFMGMCVVGYTCEMILVFKHKKVK